MLRCRRVRPCVASPGEVADDGKGDGQNHQERGPLGGGEAVMLRVVSAQVPNIKMNPPQVYMCSSS